jgi:hypothetical protein
MKTLLILLSAILVGCAPKTHHEDEIYKNPIVPEPYRIATFAAIPQYMDCPFYRADSTAKYIPEASAYLDWSEDFTSWHYHGRNRMATAEELEIYQVNQQLFQDPNNNELLVKKSELEAKYADRLAELMEKDKVRYDEMIQKMINDNSGTKQQPIEATAGHK